MSRFRYNGSEIDVVMRTPITLEQDMIKRDAFLYLEGKRADFAQCSSCCFFDRVAPANYGNCTILKKRIDGGDTCGLYVPGSFSETTNVARVSPEDAGYLKDTEDRCENCRYGGGGKCKLFMALNARMPKTFDLDINIRPRGCCNAWSKKNG